MISWFPIGEPFLKWKMIKAEQQQLSRSDLAILMAKKDPDGDDLETTAEARGFLKMKYRHYYKLLGRLKVKFWIC